MSSMLRTLQRCPVCAFSELVTDQVVEGGFLVLGACPRCDHRWTGAVPRPGFPRAVPVRPGAPLRREQGIAAA
jgi:hypothetical protein